MNLKFCLLLNSLCIRDWYRDRDKDRDEDSDGDGDGDRDILVYIDIYLKSLIIFWNLDLISSFLIRS